MKFASTQELLEFFNNLDLEKSTLVFKEGEEKKGCACGGQSACQCGPKKPAEEAVVVVTPAKEAIVESLSDDPQFPLEVGSKNTFFVREYRTVPNSCGTGRVTLENREMYINMCEMNDQATIELTLNVGGKKLHNIPFVLERTDGPTRIVLEESYFDSSSDASNT